MTLNIEMIRFAHTAVTLSETLGKSTLVRVLKATVSLTVWNAATRT